MADYNRDEMRRQELRITSVDPPKKTLEIDISDDLFLRVEASLSKPILLWIQLIWIRSISGP